MNTKLLILLRLLLLQLLLPLPLPLLLPLQLLLWLWLQLLLLLVLLGFCLSGLFFHSYSRLSRLPIEERFAIATAGFKHMEVCTLYGELSCSSNHSAARLMLLFVVRKSFYIYCFLLAVLNLLQSIGCAMLGFAYISAGWWYVDCLVHCAVLFSFIFILKVTKFTASYICIHTFIRPHEEKNGDCLFLGEKWGRLQILLLTYVYPPSHRTSLAFDSVQFCTC